MPHTSKKPAYPARPMHPGKKMPEKMPMGPGGRLIKPKPPVRRPKKGM